MSTDSDPGEPGSEATQAPLEASVRPVTDAFSEFIGAQTAAGWLLVVATLVSLALVNSPLVSGFEHVLHLPLGVFAGDARLSMSLLHWVNDGLMALFFCLLVLELKREILAGELRDLRQSGAVVCAAIGGMLVPVTLFLLLVGGAPGSNGWGIVMATDTAFAIALLVLLGKRVPTALRAFVVGLAIVDDMGAIVVIALFYAEGVSVIPLLLALGAVAVLLLLNLTGVRRMLPYALVGTAIWYLLLQAGIHGTIAGVVVAAFAPVRGALPRAAFVARLSATLARFGRRPDGNTGRLADGILHAPEDQRAAADVERAARQVAAPVRRWELALDRPVALLIMPVFALCNAGVVLGLPALQAALAAPLAWGIAAGLILGKPLGIVGGVLLGRALGLAAMPDAVRLPHLAGVGLLCGIGFTMSLFIAGLSFAGDAALHAVAKQATLAASLVAGALGCAWLVLAGRGRD